MEREVKKSGEMREQERKEREMKMRRENRNERERKTERLIEVAVVTPEKLNLGINHGISISLPTFLAASQLDVSEIHPVTRQ